MGSDWCGRVVKDKHKTVTARWCYLGRGKRDRSSGSRPEPMRLPELERHIDGLHSLAGGRRSDKGYVTIIEAGFIMHAYFRQGGVYFELYGPGIEPYGAAHGETNRDAVKGVARLLSDRHSPVQYLREHSTRWSTERE